MSQQRTQFANQNRRHIKGHSLPFSSPFASTHTHTSLASLPFGLHLAPAPLTRRCPRLRGTKKRAVPRKKIIGDHQAEGRGNATFRHAVNHTHKHVHTRALNSRSTKTLCCLLLLPRPPPQPFSAPAKHRPAGHSLFDKPPKKKKGC